jgi:hypothetical protein
MKPEARECARCACAPWVAARRSPADAFGAVDVALKVDVWKMLRMRWRAARLRVLGVLLRRDAPRLSRTLASRTLRECAKLRKA